MAKAARKVKWSIGADEPEDLQEFLSNDEIVIKNTNRKTKEVNWPSKGPHTFVVRKVTSKPNRNGDDRVAVMVVLKNPTKHEDAGWNGYAIFDGFNITEQGTPFLKRWLKSLGLTWKDFYNNSKAVDEGNDKSTITQIGRVKFDGNKDVTVKAIVVVKPADDFNDDEHLEIRRYIPLDDEPDEEPDEDEDEDEGEEFDVDEDEDDEPDEDEDEDDEDEDDEDLDEDEEDEDEDEEDEEYDDEDEDEEDEDEEDDEDEEEALRDELKSKTIAVLKKRALRSARKAGVDADDMPARKAALIDWIVEIELAEPPF